MARGILAGLGLTEDQLLAMRDAALDAYTSGGRMTTALQHASGNGVQRQKAWGIIENLTADDVLREVKYALWRLEPQKWAACAPGWRTSSARIIS